MNNNTVLLINFHLKNDELVGVTTGVATEEEAKSAEEMMGDVIVRASEVREWLRSRNTA